MLVVTDAVAGYALLRFPLPSFIIYSNCANSNINQISSDGKVLLFHGKEIEAFAILQLCSILVIRYFYRILMVISLIVVEVILSDLLLLEEIRRVDLGEEEP